MARNASHPAPDSRRLRRRQFVGPGAFGTTAWLLAAVSGSRKQSAPAPTAATTAAANAAPKRGGVRGVGEIFDPAFTMSGGSPIGQNAGNYYLVYAALEQLVRYRQS